MASTIFPIVSESRSFAACTAVAIVALDVMSTKVMSEMNQRWNTSAWSGQLSLATRA